MTRRERILTALAGGLPDRPPIAFDGHEAAMQPVFAHYGATTRNDLYRIAGIECFSVWDWSSVMGRYTGPLATAADGTPTDFWGGISQRRYALAEVNTVAAVAAHPWPRADQFDFSHIHAAARQLHDQEMTVAAGHLGLGYQMHAALRGNEAALFDVTEPTYMAAYLERLTAFTVDYIDALLTAGRGLIDVVRADDDVGTMDRLMISPALWRRYYKPAWQRAFAVVHDHGAKVWFHSCGCIRPLLDDLVEIGIDCWNPFPEYVTGNDHAPLRAWRRGKIALDGGVNHLTLVRGTAADVVRETRRVLETFAPDGGLLIGPSQVFPPDIPIAFFETARAYRN